MKENKKQIMHPREFVDVKQITHRIAARLEGVVKNKGINPIKKKRITHKDL